MPKVILNSLINASNAQRLFAEKAVSILQQIVNHPSFQEEVSSWNYSTREFRNDSDDYEDFDNERIWAIISGGKELYQPANQEINLQCKFERWDKYPKAVGEVIPPYPLITTNIIWLDMFMSERDPLSLAAHWMHEWMHVAGFYHPEEEELQWEDVAYSIGNIVVSVGRLILGGDQKSAAPLTSGRGYEESAKLGICNVITKR
jgi:hypothetical protein